MTNMGQKRRDISSPLLKVGFHCRAEGCGARFEAPPARCEDAPEREYHPFQYFVTCAECGEEAEQAAWQVNLMKAWPNATGPRTPEGKAATAANLDGHPTPQEALLTRFNAMKHGLFARTANYFPARPGKYPHCEGCEHLETEACVPHKACLKRTELFLKHQVAFDTQNPALLVRLRSDTQAGIQALIDDMLLVIAQDGGPRIKSPEWYYDKSGELHLVKWTDEDGNEVQLHKLEAHPLLNVLMAFISKNSMTLNDLEMTPRAQDEQEALSGFMEARAGEQVAALEHKEKQTRMLESLSGMIERSHQRLNHDAVLIEHGDAGDG
jgi:hypothetical protein